MRLYHKAKACVGFGQGLKFGRGVGFALLVTTQLGGWLAWGGVAGGCARRGALEEPGEGGAIVGQFQARVDASSSTWHMAPGSMSNQARVTLCAVVEDAPRFGRDCRSFGADRSGVVRAVLPAGQWEITEARFEMPAREGFDRPSPSIVAPLDGGIGATAFRYGRVEELVVSFEIPAELSVVPGEIIDLGQWRLTIADADRPPAQPCPPGSSPFAALPPDPTAAWALPLLCQGELDDQILSQTREQTTHQAITRWRP